jgi:cytochrome c-type biogenesis protein
MLEISGIGVLTAFVAGLISFLSPCVLPLVPGYVSFIAGQSLDEMKQRGLASKETLAVAGLSICFVLGFATVFIIFGASATAIGSIFRAYRYELNIFGGVIVILFGLFMTGLFSLNWLQQDFRFHGDAFGRRPVAAYMLGLAFAFGWTPCIGPILGSILTVSATSGSVSDGASLLAIYSMGLGVPFILAAIFTDRFLHHAKRLRRYTHTLQVVAGVLLIIMGIAMVTGYLSTFSIWLLKALPWLSELG